MHKKRPHKLTSERIAALPAATKTLRCQKRSSPRTLDCRFLPSVQSCGREVATRRQYVIEKPAQRKPLKGPEMEFP